MTLLDLFSLVEVRARPVTFLNLFTSIVFFIGYIERKQQGLDYEIIDRIFVLEEKLRDKT
ncbi:MAG: hypothetical protein GY863_24695 [bacterium]|nr:hypothetical protein [bacterium]